MYIIHSVVYLELVKSIYAIYTSIKVMSKMPCKWNYNITWKQKLEKHLCEDNMNYS